MSPDPVSNDSEVDPVPSQAPRACIVTVEGLGCNLVGCYGNSICPTPGWDRFASKSIVADQFWMDSTDTLDVLQSMWSGVHRASACVFPGSDSQAQEPARLKNRNSSGITSPGLFVTDDSRVAMLAEECLDGEVVLIETVAGEGAASPQLLEGTAFLHLVSQAMAAWVECMDELPWLWIHSKGLRGEWDAPYEYRRTMCDEGDPEPPQDVIPPRLKVDADTDPDVVFGWACGAGGQAIAMDESWAWMERCLADMGVASNCLMILAGVQGYPLGEHWHIGLEAVGKAHGDGCSEGRMAAEDGVHSSRDSQSSHSSHIDSGDYAGAYSERLHCPLILRPGGRLELGLRCSQFLQPHHLASLIEDWIEWEGGGPSGSDGFQSPDVAAVDRQEEFGWTWATLILSCGIARDRWLPYQRSAFAMGEQDIALIVPSWSVRWSRHDGGVSHGDAVGSAVGSTAGLPTASDEVVIGASSRREELEPWLTQEDAVGAFSRVELFVMPEDRWQQNEVSNRAPDIVEALIPLRNAWLAYGGDGSNRLRELLWALDESLLNPVR
jgi:hypothetical protein